MAAARKWTRLEDLAVLHLYRGKVAPDGREALALASALERSPQSLATRLAAFAGVDPANPQRPAGKARPTALTQSVWAEYLANRTAVAAEGQRAYLGILNRYSMGRP